MRRMGRMGRNRYRLRSISEINIFSSGLEDILYDRTVYPVILHYHPSHLARRHHPDSKTGNLNSQRAEAIDENGKRREGCVVWVYRGGGNDFQKWGWFGAIQSAASWGPEVGVWVI